MDDRLNLWHFLLKSIIPWRVSAFLESRIPMLYFLEKLFLGEYWVINSEDWFHFVRLTKIRKKYPLFLDRQTEISEFFNFRSTRLARYYLKHGPPASHRFKAKIESEFEKCKNNSKELTFSYRSTAFDYTLRLMLAYERFTLFLPYVAFFLKEFRDKKRTIRVLDYGCGVADIGLLCSILGWDVYLCDLDTPRFDFTLWRFEKRNLEPHVFKVDSSDEYVRLEEGFFDIVFVTEVLEHVRDPLRLLKNITKALRRGGYLFDSLCGRFDREAVGDHLAESIKIGQSEEYRKFYKFFYQSINPDDPMNYVFRKIR